MAEGRSPADPTPDPQAAAIRIRMYRVGFGDCFLITLPVNILTLGLFTFVINALLFMLAAHLVHGFSVAGFWSAFFGALLYSVISFAIGALIDRGRKVGSL